MKLLFVHIPKAAGASFTTYINQQRQNPYVDFEFQSIGHRTIYEGHMQLGTLSYNHALCITRNTYSRMASLYNWAPKKIRKSLKRAQAAGNIPWKWQLNQDKSAWNRGIGYYIDYLRERNDSATKSQLDYMEGCNVILSQENLKEDIKQLHAIAGTSGCPGYTKHVLNSSVQELWSKEFRRAIKYHFEDELDHFKYLPPV